MMRHQPDQLKIDRYPVRLRVIQGNGTVAAGAVINGYFNNTLRVWHTDRGLFRREAVTYATSDPCGKQEGQP
jgi:hypothetical protein